MFCNISAREKKFMREHLEKRYAPPTFSFNIPNLRYQSPNGMVNKIGGNGLFIRVPFSKIT